MYLKISVMKKFLSILVLFAVAGNVMANVDVPKPSTGMAVMKSESGFKLFYKGNKVQDVTVKIYNEKGAAVFSEKIKNHDSFIRPYNLNTIGEGQYTVELSTADGKQKEMINYTHQKAEKLVNLIRIKNSDRYMLTLGNHGEGALGVKIFDSSDHLVYTGNETLNGDFAKIFDLKKVGEDFRFELSFNADDVQTLRYQK
jgi:hypothetical protein